MTMVHKSIRGFNKVDSELYFERNKAVTKGHGWKLMKRAVRRDESAS